MDAQLWRDVESLYHDVLECDSAERARLLNAADPVIRREVELLLNQDGSLLDKPAWEHLAPTLAVGSLVGRYEIEALLGAGGMGEVFRARDTRLGRDVAIKTSRARFSDRFEREARAISALNHPSICTLYDVGPNYLVMELIEGETLAARLKRGKLPFEQVLRFGTQIAEALAEAHARGIVHRDLKPSNIMLTRHGVKVLDFGLARMLSEGGITDTRDLLGTPAYVAPEQVERREPSRMTDLFSFGLVLYEMAAGKLPVPGASLGHMLAAGSPVSLAMPSREDSAIPSSFDRLIGALLQRDSPRLPLSASEVGRQLAALARTTAVAPHRFFAGVSLTLLLLVVSGSLWFSRRSVLPTEGKTVARKPGSYTQLTSFTDSAVAPALSPDGRMLAFFRSDRPFLTPDQIWVKLLPDGEPIEISHDPRPKYNLAFSPDGTRIAYTVFGQLFDSAVISPLGGDPQFFLRNAAGLSWLDEDHLLYSQIDAGVHMGVVTSRLDGSESRKIYFPFPGRGMVHYSYLSPDRKWILLVEMDPQWQPCRLVPFSGGSIGKQVGPAGACTSAAWSPDGNWMYFAVRVAGRRHLWRQRFPDGRPEQVTFGSTEEEGLAMAADGRSLITSISTQQTTVWIHDERGERALSTEGYAGAAAPAFSPDGKRLYYLLRRESPESPTELCRTDLASGKSEVVLPGLSLGAFDISPEEKEVVFSTHPEGKPSELWISPLDRSSPPQRIASHGETNPHFGPGGQILFRFSEGNLAYLGAMAHDGSGAHRAYPDPIIDVWGASPDRRFALVSTGPSANQGPEDRPIWVVDLNGGRARELCAGLCSFQWSPDGRYFYVELNEPSREEPRGKMVAIPVPPGESLPRFPAPFRKSEDWATLRGARIVDAARVVPGPRPGVYAFLKSGVHANLFRIPLH